MFDRTWFVINLDCTQYYYILICNQLLIKASTSRGNVLAYLLAF